MPIVTKQEGSWPENREQAFLSKEQGSPSSYYWCLMSLWASFSKEEEENLKSFMNFLIFHYWPLIQSFLETPRRPQKTKLHLQIGYESFVGHQFAMSLLDESNEIPEKLTKLWQFSEATNGKFARCCQAIYLIRPRLLLNSSSIMHGKTTTINLEFCHPQRQFIGNLRGMCSANLNYLDFSASSVVR